MKNKNFFCTVLSATFASCLLFSCTSSDEMAENSGNELNAVENFLLSNNDQLVDFDINYDVAKGYKVTFDVYSENPFKVNSDGTITKAEIAPIMSGMTDENGEYKFSRMLPGGVKEVFITSDCVGVPVLLHGVIANGSVKTERYEMNANTESSRAASFNYLTLGKWNKLGKPEYIDNSITCSIKSNELKSITKALPEWKKVASDYALTKDIQVTKDAEIWLSIISDKSLLNNAIGYYCYNKADGINGAKEIIAFPSTRTYSLLNGLESGEYIKLQYRNPSTGEMSSTFPAGTCVCFVLRTSAFNSLTGGLSAGSKQFFTNSALNPESTDNVHASILKTSEGNVIIGFEDIYNEGFFGGDNDCNDVIMHVKSMPADAVSNAAVADDDSDIVKEDNGEAVRPLSNIIESAAYDEVLKDLVIYAKSKFKIVNGNVVGVYDEIYVGSTFNISKILFSNYGDMISYLPSNVFVFDGFTLSRLNKGLLHTTVKEMGFTASEGSRAGNTYSLDKAPAEIINELILEHKDALKNGSYLNLTMYVDFEPVPYAEFISTIPLPPYTPFIVNN